MKQVFFIIICIVFVSCKETVETDTTDTITEANDTIVAQETEELIEIEGDLYTEYYPGKQRVKIQGYLDEQGERNGKWLLFSEEGEELSMSMYKNGLLHGHSIVKYPNGAIHYLGEYDENKMVGIWKTYSPEGKLVTEKDYGHPQ